MDAKTTSQRAHTKRFVSFKGYKVDVDQFMRDGILLKHVMNKLRIDPIVQLEALPTIQSLKSMKHSEQAATFVKCSPNDRDLESTLASICGEPEPRKRRRVSKPKYNTQDLISLFGEMDDDPDLMAPKRKPARRHSCLVSIPIKRVGKKRLSDIFDRLAAISDKTRTTVQRVHLFIDECAEEFVADRPVFGRAQAAYDEAAHALVTEPVRAYTCFSFAQVKLKLKTEVKFEVNDDENNNSAACRTFIDLTLDSADDFVVPTVVPRAVAPSMPLLSPVTPAVSLDSAKETPGIESQVTPPVFDSVKCISAQASVLAVPPPSYDANHCVISRKVESYPATSKSNDIFVQNQTSGGSIIVHSNTVCENSPTINQTPSTIHYHQKLIPIPRKVLQTSLIPEVKSNNCNAPIATANLQTDRTNHPNLPACFQGHAIFPNLPVIDKPVLVPNQNYVPTPTPIIIQALNSIPNSISKQPNQYSFPIPPISAQNNLKLLKKGPLPRAQKTVPTTVNQSQVCPTPRPVPLPTPRPISALQQMSNSLPKPSIPLPQRMNVQQPAPVENITLRSLLDDKRMLIYFCDVLYDHYRRYHDFLRLVDFYKKEAQKYQSNLSYEKDMSQFNSYNENRLFEFGNELFNDVVKFNFSVYNLGQILDYVSEKCALNGMTTCHSVQIALILNDMLSFAQKPNHSKFTARFTTQLIHTANAIKKRARYSKIFTPIVLKTIENQINICNKITTYIKDMELKRQKELEWERIQQKQRFEKEEKLRKQKELESLANLERELQSRISALRPPEPTVIPDSIATEQPTTLQRFKDVIDWVQHTDQMNESAIEETSSDHSNSLVINEEIKAEIDDVIDLTWIDENDDDVILMEVSNYNSLKIKTEIKSEVNGCDSPSDSGIDSPSPIVVPNSSAVNYECFCGKKAQFSCACNISVYCSEECQINDWQFHRITCLSLNKAV